MRIRLAVAIATQALVLAQISGKKEQQFDPLPKPLTSAQQMFRSPIEQAANKGPNFAGHYTIAELGCGLNTPALAAADADCKMIVVIDNLTGDIHDGPFGVLPRGYIEHGRLSYGLAGPELTAIGCPSASACGTYTYEWTGLQFKLLHQIPVKHSPEMQRRPGIVFGLRDLTNGLSLGSGALLVAAISGLLAIVWAKFFSGASVWLLALASPLAVSCLLYSLPVLLGADDVAQYGAWAALFITPWYLAGTGASVYVVVLLKSLKIPSPRLP